jgi:hypothetical protein
MICCCTSCVDIACDGGASSSGGIGRLVSALAPLRGKLEVFHTAAAARQAVVVVRRVEIVPATVRNTNRKLLEILSTSVAHGGTQMFKHVMD